MQDEQGETLDWVVLKIVQRCNLNCSYCYVYNRGDDSWRRRPAVISDDVLSRLADRISEHCGRHSLESFTVEFHGGEPLLVGKARMQEIVDLLRDGCSKVDLKIILQTNGTLLDLEWLDIFDRNGMEFGISLDGPPELADKHRVFLNGRGSTNRVLRNIEQLRKAGPAFNRRFGGVLCVVDPNPQFHGGRLVEWFAQQGFDFLDFLLPDGNYANLPPGWAGVAPVQRFLLDAFDTWYEMGIDAPQIRLFETMLLGFMGVTPQLDALGGDLDKLCVVESDGSIGVSDVMRFVQSDFATDKLNVFDHALDCRSHAYEISDLQRPCSTCLKCPYLKSCGGGYLPHRFDGESFDMPSLYCGALYALGERMTAAIRADVPGELIQVSRPTPRPNVVDLDPPDRLRRL